MVSNKIQEIIEHRKHSIAEDIKYKISLNRHVFRENRKYLSQAIKDNPGISIISEIKPASPTLGNIKTEIDIVETAKEMEKAGAIGLSVLTEPNFFNGSYQNLKLAVESTNIPCLMKDFVIDSVQCFIAYQLGATNILIINAIRDHSLEAMVSTAIECSLEPLIEIHNIEEVSDIIHLAENGIQPKLVGVNNRNLETLEVDLNTSHEIIPELKKALGEELVVISESGIETQQDIEFLQSSGADAFLIGSSIMKAENIYKKICTK